MRRIIINERDLTVSNNPEVLTDVVYIPGLAIGGDVEADTPTFCADLAEFRQHFGTDLPIFRAQQLYPEGFAAAALPGADATTPTTAVQTENFTAVTPEGSENPTEQGWYEYDNSTSGYILSSDTEVNSEKTYYNRSVTEDVVPTESRPVMYAQGAPDKSYIYACELLSVGIPVVYERLNTSIDSLTVEEIYTKLASVYDTTSILTDKNELNIKYLTSGAYPVFEYNGSSIANAMRTLASTRGDCVAIIDHTDNPDRSLTITASSAEDPLVDTESVYSSYVRWATANSSSTYATMITPWYEVGTSVNYNYTFVEALTMPGSFAYLTALAESIRTNANWLAIAGVARGRVPNFIKLHINSVMTNTIAESYTNSTGVSLNPITNIRPYGYCIWGNKTGLNAGANSGFATSFLNIRNLISDVKKQAYVAAKSSLFEQNTDILWVNFKSLIMPLLDQMVSGAGLKNYKILKLANSDREIIRAKIVLVPVYAVEQFIIDVAITDQDVEIAENEGA